MNANTFAYANRPRTARLRRRIGVALTLLAVLFLLMDATMKLLALPDVLTTTAQLGFPGTAQFARDLGAALFVWGGLYLRDERLGRMLNPATPAR